LPKGQMFSFQVGGQLWKVRMPLPRPSPDDAMPKDLQELTQRMRANYNEQAGHWWSASGGGPTLDFDPDRVTPPRTSSAVDASVPAQESP